MTDPDSFLGRAHKAAHKAMYNFEHGNWYLDKPYPVGWSDDQLEVGIEAAAPYIEAFAIDKFGRAMRKALTEDGEGIFTPEMVNLLVGMAEYVSQDIIFRADNGLD